MSLTDFGIAHRGALNGRVIGATPINENIAESLFSAGINPDDVNKLVLPAGFSNVGHLTILTSLLGIIGVNIPDWVADIIKDPSAVCGEISFPLSRRYEVLTRIAPMSTDSGLLPHGTRATLAVVRFYDIRSDFAFRTNLGVLHDHEDHVPPHDPDDPPHLTSGDPLFGVLPAGNADARWNCYDNTWSLGTYWNDPYEDSNDPPFHQYGVRPIDFLRATNPQSPITSH